MGRISVDSYSELQEQRKAVGSVAGEFGVTRPEYYFRLFTLYKKFP